MIIVEKFEGNADLAEVVVSADRIGENVGDKR